MRRVVYRNCSNCHSRIHKITKNVRYVCGVCLLSYETEEEALKCESTPAPYVYPAGTEMVIASRFKDLDGIYRYVYIKGETANTPNIVGHTIDRSYNIHKDGQHITYVSHDLALASVKLAELFREQNITQLPSNV